MDFGGSLLRNFLELFGGFFLEEFFGRTFLEEVFGNSFREEFL